MEIIIKTVSMLLDKCPDDFICIKPDATSAFLSSSRKAALEEIVNDPTLRQTHHLVKMLYMSSIALIFGIDDGTLSKDLESARGSMQGCPLGGYNTS